MADNIGVNNKAVAASLSENKEMESQHPTKGADRGAQLIGSQRIGITEEDVSPTRTIVSHVTENCVRANESAARSTSTSYRC